jgi:hypothetical protein
MSKPLYEDPVVAEIHAIRAKMLVDCGGDHRKLMEQVRTRERASDRRVIAVPPAPERRTKECTGATDSAVSETDSSPAAQ